MAKTYVRITNEKVVEVVLPAFYDGEHPDRQEGDPSRIGLEIPIGERFTAEIVATLVDVTDTIPQPQPNWTHIDGVFAPPKVPIVDLSVAILARMSQIDVSSIQFLRRVAVGAATEQELGILEALDAEYSLLKGSL